MFFSLTALGPASPRSRGLPPATACPGPMHARPPREPGPGGREAGAAASPGTARLCAPTPPRRSPPPPLRPTRTRCPACLPPSAHPAPTRGALTFRASVRLAPGAPGHVLGAASARPTPLPALGGEPGTVPAAWEPGPGRGTFRRGCVRGGVRALAVPGEGEAQMPGGRPPHPRPRPLS